MIIKDNDPKSLEYLWAKHDKSKPLSVRNSDGYLFHVKQKTNSGGFILIDGHGATVYVLNGAKEKRWFKQ